MNPKGHANAEIKRYKIDYPVFYGRGQKMNRDFEVKVLPRLILIDSNGKVRQDILFLKEEKLRIEIQKLLDESMADEETTGTEVPHKTEGS